jgi:prefoldin alpha subunit
MAKVKEVPLEKLTIDQLDYVGKQIEQEISNYSQYYSSLRIANNKFLDNKDYIKDLRNYQDREILVPMTSSLYIPGKCSDVKKLTIEIGGNFYVETTIDKADKFCDRKLESIKKNMDKIDEIIKNKNEQLNAVNQQLIEKQLKTEPKK